MKRPFRIKNTPINYLLVAVILLISFLWLHHLHQQSSLALGQGQATPIKLDPGFDLSNLTIPKEAILSGGPPKDGIPAIHTPQFVAASEARYLDPNDLIISVTLSGQTRAYPIRILVWHEIVNDVINDQAIAITYCPLCGTSMVFDRDIGGQRRSFGVSGLLFQSDVLMYDKESHSLWSQLMAKGVSGEASNVSMPWLASEHSTWTDWKKRNPNGLVLSTQTGFQRDYDRMPYIGYETTDRTMFPVPSYRKELKPKDWIAGIRLEGISKAYPENLLRNRSNFEDTVDSVTLQIDYESSARRLRVVNKSTGKEIPYAMAYWFAWQAFYPETLLWKPPALAN